MGGCCPFVLLAGTLRKNRKVPAVRLPRGGKSWLFEKKCCLCKDGPNEVCGAKSIKNDPHIPLCERLSTQYGQPAMEASASTCRQQLPTRPPHRECAPYPAACHHRCSGSVRTPCFPPYARTKRLPGSDRARACRCSR